MLGTRSRLPEARVYALACAPCRPVRGMTSVTFAEGLASNSKALRVFEGDEEHGT